MICLSLFLFLWFIPICQSRTRSSSQRTFNLVTTLVGVRDIRHGVGMIFVSRGVGMVLVSRGIDMILVSRDIVMILGVTWYWHDISISSLCVSGTVNI